VEAQLQTDLDSRHTIASTFTAKSMPQTLPQSCAGLRVIFWQRKGHRAFIQLGWVVLAKLGEIEVGFAHNPGTMPPSSNGVFGFVAVYFAGFRVK